MPYRACGPFLLALLLAGCSEDSRPSADENRQLQSTEEMLDAAPDELSNIDDNALGESQDNSAEFEHAPAP